MTSDALILHAFNLIEGVTPSKLLKLLEACQTLENAWNAGTKLLQQAGFEKPLIEAFAAQRNKISFEKETKLLEQHGINLITFYDESYPKLLREIPGPPYILYCRGQLERALSQPAIAVVGTRKISPYGKLVTETLVADLARTGVTVVSGLAVGVDGLAHSTALKSGGLTLAILGSGIDKQSVYPSVNRDLSEKIISSGGAVLSEFPPHTAPLKFNFPRRNRIISGLALGTLVVEADLNSGSLITARHALDQNREVFAVPGPIFSSTSKGANELLKLGAKPVTCVEDILEELGLEIAEIPNTANEDQSDNAEEKIILKLLTSDPIHINALIKLSGLPTQKVASTLTVLEIKGLIKNLGGLQYVSFQR